jgi:hypothetical protein
MEGASYSEGGLLLPTLREDFYFTLPTLMEGASHSEGRLHSEKAFILVKNLQNKSQSLIKVRIT